MQQFIPPILGVLEGTLQEKGINLRWWLDKVLTCVAGEASSLLQHSCLSSLRVIFASVSQFLSPYLGQILHLTTHSKLVGDVSNYLT